MCEMNNRTFSFIYGCALHDAILQKAFLGKKDWIATVTSAQKPIKEYINSVLLGKFKEIDAKELHNNVFLQTAKDVCDLINKNRPDDAVDIFSFGNAQKLINIVVKHVYAHTYSLNILEHADIRENFRFCHCPMDSIMLSHVWKMYKKEFGAEERMRELGDDFLKSWGSEDFDLIENERIQPQRYIRYQNAIEKLKDPDIFSIEYDYIVWKNDQSYKK